MQIIRAIPNTKRKLIAGVFSFANAARMLPSTTGKAVMERKMSRIFLLLIGDRKINWGPSRCCVHADEIGRWNKWKLAELEGFFMAFSGNR